MDNPAFNQARAKIYLGKNHISCEHNFSEHCRHEKGQVVAGWVVDHGWAKMLASAVDSSSRAGSVDLFTFDVVVRRQGGVACILNRSRDPGDPPYHVTDVPRSSHVKSSIELYLKFLRANCYLYMFGQGKFI